jgi:ribosomal protein S18 acetylase RimI-like enzyme
MTAFTIRHLTPADAADYRDIRLAALQNAPEAFGSTYEMEAARPLSGWEERLQMPGAFAAFLDGKIVGLARFVQDSDSPKERHKGSVYAMYVVPEARGQGIGSALLEALIGDASGIVEQLRLGVVDDNAAAIRLYEKHGFEVYGREMRALKSDGRYFDEVLMVRFLDKPPP